MHNRGFGKDGSKALSDLAFTGVSWQALANLFRFGGQFGVGIALARLLPPEDFGVVGIATIATGFAATLAGLGLGPAIIQRRTVTERHLRVCQTASLVISALIMLLLQLSAETIASFFDDHRVTAVLRVLSIIFLFTGFSITADAVLRRRLSFKIIVTIELITSLIGYGFVSIVLALAGFGYWSLVGGTIVQSFLGSILKYGVVRNGLKPLLSWTELSELFQFSLGISAEKSINYWALQGDYVMIGRLMTSEILGYYSKAYTLMQLPQKFVGMALSRVLFPAASAVHDDPKRFRRAYLTTSKLSIITAVPISAGLVILAPEFILTLYGVEWQPAVPVLQILGLFGIFRMGYNTASAFIHASGRTIGLVFSQVVYALIVIVGTWIGIRHSGMLGAGWAVGSAILVMWLLVSGQANSVAGVSGGEFTRAVVVSIVPGTVLGAGLFLFVHYLRVIGLDSGITLVTATVVYGIACCITLYIQIRRLNHPVLSQYLDGVKRALLRLLQRRSSHV